MEIKGGQMVVTGADIIKKAYIARPKNKIAYDVSPCTISRMEDGRFMAYQTEPKNWENAVNSRMICGVGCTPNKALKNLWTKIYGN